MSGIDYEERASDSPYVETITRGWTAGAGSSSRPAECHWHMVIVRQLNRTQLIVVGPLTSAGIVSWQGAAEILWIKFKLGTFMPRLPAKNFLDIETILPAGAFNTFWLDGSAWQFPDFENAETFVAGLVRNDVVQSDPVVNAALRDQLPVMPLRTVRHRFLHTTGVTQSYIRQMKRAQHAESLLLQGVSILDTVHEAGYFDQPHLTRSLKRFVGKTPAQLIPVSQPDCHYVQASGLELPYRTQVR